MKPRAFVIALSALAGAAPAFGAADATWVAASRLENGLSPYCAGGQFPAPAFNGQTDWVVAIEGDRLTLASQAVHRSYTFDLRALQPDGSGRAVGKDDRNRELHLTFDPGSGARPFHMGNSIDACRYVFAPLR